MYYKITVLVICVCLALAGCNKKSGFDFNALSTWKSVGELEPENIYEIPVIDIMPEASFPWAGTVSHHLLAAKQIDDWFRNIAQRRKVKNFFVICPSHFGLSTQEWSVSDDTWNCGENNYVYSNLKITDRICKTLEVDYDRQVFKGEHGVSVLVPYIQRYFPKAKIVAIALYGEPPLNQANAQKLTDAIAPWFDAKGKNDNFLLISTDFSHHGNIESTTFKDARTMSFFNKPDNSTWIYCGCDNRPGMYTLAHFLTDKTKSSILYHTNSYELSKMDEDDITSYFFSFFYE